MSGSVNRLDDALDVDARVEGSGTEEPDLYVVAWFGVVKVLPPSEVQSIGAVRASGDLVRPEAVVPTPDLVNPPHSQSPMSLHLYSASRPGRAS